MSGKYNMLNHIEHLVKVENSDKLQKLCIFERAFLLMNKCLNMATNNESTLNIVDCFLLNAFASPQTIPLRFLSSSIHQFRHNNHTRHH